MSCFQKYCSHLMVYLGYDHRGGILFGPCRSFHSAVGAHVEEFPRSHLIAEMVQRYARLVSHRGVVHKLCRSTVLQNNELHTEFITYISFVCFYLFCCWRGWCGRRNKLTKTSCSGPATSTTSPPILYSPETDMDMVLVSLTCHRNHLHCRLYFTLCPRKWSFTTTLYLQGLQRKTRTHFVFISSRWVGTNRDLSGTRRKRRNNAHNGKPDSLLWLRAGS